MAASFIGGTIDCTEPDGVATNVAGSVFTLLHRLNERANKVSNGKLTYIHLFIYASRINYLPVPR